MNEILAQWPALAVFPVRIDVVVREIRQAVFFALAREMRAGSDRRERCVLRAKNDFINFALARGELSIGRNGARNVGRVAGVLCADIHDHDVAVLDLARQLVIVQRRGVWPRADNGRIALSFRAAAGVNFHHF